jgi:hypothetical protein
MVAVEISQGTNRMRIFSFLIAILFVGTSAPANAHVGSPDVFYEGDAGPYHLFVTVRMPKVIPGLAQVEIRSQSSEVREIQLTIRRVSGFGYSLHAIPDLAQRSAKDPNFFVSSLWVMETYDLQVRIEVDGGRGKAELGVPIPAFAQTTLRMQKSLGVFLFCCMLFLTTGVVSVVGASVREAKLKPGDVPTSKDFLRAQIAMFTASMLLVIVILLGNAWWSGDASDSQAQTWSSNSPRALATMQPDGRRLVLRVQGQSEFWAKFVNPENFIPDHGHLMHLFLIRLPYMDYMYHLHPARIEGGSFAESLPAILAGKYQIFADIVDGGGVPWTAVGQIDLPNVAGPPLSGDDAQASGGPLTPTKDDAKLAPLPDGGRMIWERDSSTLRANVPMSFRFRIEDRNGKAAEDLEPYMGMAGHAAFVRSDSSVFAHVHPAGSVSMAALEMAQASILPAPQGANNLQPGNQASSHAGMTMPTHALSSVVSFPYGFPKAGLYRIFVQVKRSGHIQTGVFDAHVE